MGCVVLCVYVLPSSLCPPAALVPPGLTRYPSAAAAAAAANGDSSTDLLASLQAGSFIYLFTDHAGRAKASHLSVVNAKKKKRKTDSTHRLKGF